MSELVILWGIVALCFVVFFIWLISMALCPNKLIYWLSATEFDKYSVVPKQSVSEHELPIPHFSITTPESAHNSFNDSLKGVTIVTEATIVQINTANTVRTTQ